MVGSGIRKKPIPDPGSRIRIRIRNTENPKMIGHGRSIDNYIYCRLFTFSVFCNISIKKIQVAQRNSGAC
jgi:hypothetical protein